MSQSTIPVDPQKFKRLRKERDPELSQYDLAKKAGLSRSFISDIENGRRQPRALAARSIAEVLGVSVEDLT